MLKKRKFPRIDKSWHLKYRPLDDKVVDGSPLGSLAVNVSGGGVCFTAREAVPADVMLALEIASADLEMPIIAMAKAVWCKKRRLDSMYALMLFRITNNQPAQRTRPATKPRSRPTLPAVPFSFEFSA